MKAGAATTIGAVGLAGCTGNCEDDDCYEEGGGEVEGEGDGFDSLADEPAASSSEVELDTDQQAAFVKGSEGNPWTKDDIRSFLDHHKADLGPEPSIYFTEDRA